jgi:uncharacterized protein YndB with AHSA1/START domain
MFKRLVILLALVLGGLAAYIAMQPSEFLIVRSRTLAAPPEVVFAYVSDFHRWTEWSPWEKRDPALRREYSGAEAGEGAVYHWVGNEEVGAGRMTIMNAEPPHAVTIRLEFLKPFPAVNTAQFDILKGGLGTEVTWSMTGRNGFVSKAFALVMDVDKLVGRDFEQGLADLDTVTAAATPPPVPALAEEPAPGTEAAPAQAPAGEAAAPAEAPPAAPAEGAPPADAAPAAPSQPAPPASG